MSDTSEDTKSDSQNDREGSICRDFIRGTCDRKFCKFKHESEPPSLNFCHDFQNNVCPRPKCKFIHCTSDEVEDFKNTGEMSDQILAEACRKNQLPGVAPICNQFRKGLCRRAFCKYRHLTAEEEENEIVELIHNQKRKNQVPENGLHVRYLNGYSMNCEDEMEPLRKRKLMSSEVDLMGGDRLIFKGYYTGTPPGPILSGVDARILMLEEENKMLHKEVAHLKRQVSDLTATNEFLLDQNANLRISTKHNGGVNVPNVTITNTNTPQPPQQVIRTVTASVATVPVSLATVSTCNPVSGNPVSIAGVPSVSIASPAQLLAPSQQILVTTNPTSQLAIANSSQAQLAIAQQNLANNLAQQAAAQPQQITLATTTQQLNQQLTSQAQQLANQQQIANQQLTSQAQQLATQQLTSQAQQQLATQQMTSQAQQLALASTQQQLTSQAQLALANTSQQLTSQAQLAMANSPQLTSQAQQLTITNTPQQLTVANIPQQLALASTNQQLLAQQNLASSQQLEIHRNNQMNAINTSQTIAMSNATAPMVSYPIMTHSINHALSH